MTRDTLLREHAGARAITPEKWTTELGKSARARRPIEFIDLAAQQDRVRRHLETNVHGVLHNSIMPVSLCWQCADMDAINAIAEHHRLPVVEDGAQGLGTTYKGL